MGNKQALGIALPIFYYECQERGQDCPIFGQGLSPPRACCKSHVKSRETIWAVVGLASSLTAASKAASLSLISLRLAFLPLPILMRSFTGAMGFSSSSCRIGDVTV